MSNNKGRALGFFELSAPEIQLLNNFDPSNHELLQPERTSLGKEAYNIMRSLKQKALVTGNRPFKLTREGIRVKKSLRDDLQ